MHKISALAVVAALAALPLASLPSVASAASLGFCFGQVLFCNNDDQNDLFNDNTTFDLGVDVGGLPLTRPAVNEFMATLSAEGQTIMIHTCQHYLTGGSVKSPRTIQFCRVLLGA